MRKLLSLNLVVVALLWCSSFLVVHAGNSVIGTGTPASCTEDAFDKALAARGLITFNCGQQPFTLVLTNTKTISADVAIDGAKLITLSGNKTNRVFWVNSGVTLDLKNLAVADGYALKPAASAPLNSPSKTTSAATATRLSFIRQSPTPTLTRTATPLPSPTQPTDQALREVYSIGGGIYNNGGTVKITNVSLTGNQAIAFGGAVFNLGGTVTIAGSAITDNHLQPTQYGMNDGTYIEGSGVANYAGTVSIDNTTISGNSGPSAAIYNGSKGSLTITNSTIGNNGGQEAFGAGVLNRGGTLTLTGSTISNNQARTGGGVALLDGTSTLSGVTFSGNAAQTASALYIDKGTVTIDGSLFTKNDNSRGAVYVQAGANVTVTSTTFTGNSSEYASGIYNFQGNLTVISSTFTNGAGSAISSQGTLGIFNSTITGHRSSYSGDDAVQVYSGTATIVNTTIARNERNGLAGAGDITLRNSMVVYNGLNCSGKIIDGGNNLQFPETSCGASIKTADPLLDKALGNNGGPVQTLALLPSSPAIDAGNPSVCVSPPINNLDQRGFIRPVDGNGDSKRVCDIGAFEFNAKASNAASAATTAPLSPVCPDLNGTTDDVVRADIPADAVDGGKIFCRVITTNAEIGVQSVIDRGVVRAAEITALSDDGATLIPKFKKAIAVCLQGNGILLHLPATTTPRVPVQLKTVSANSYTCGTIQNAGTLVLVLR